MTRTTTGKGHYQEGVLTTIDILSIRLRSPIQRLANVLHGLCNLASHDRSRLATSGSVSPPP